MTRAGLMHAPVEIQTVTLSDDGAGGQTEVWSYFDMIRGEITSRDLSETDRTGGLGNRDRITVRTHFYPELSAEMRLLWDGGIYRIISVHDPDGRRRETLISAERYSGS